MSSVVPSYLPDIVVEICGGSCQAIHVIPGRVPDNCFVLDWDCVQDSIKEAKLAIQNLTGEHQEITEADQGIYDSRYSDEAEAAWDACTDYYRTVY